MSGCLHPHLVKSVGVVASFTRQDNAMATADVLFNQCVYTYLNFKLKQSQHLNLTVNVSSKCAIGQMFMDLTWHQSI